VTSSRVVREPPGSSPGYWAGAPGVYYAADERAFYLSYRLRRPRGVEPDRGGEARIARSTDLHRFDDIWSATKDRYGSASIERSAIARGADGTWRYFTSFVDPTDGRWCVSALSAARPDGFDPARARPLFSAAGVGLEGVKDPWLLEERGVWWMFLSVALPTPSTRSASHANGDIFNTGECASATALAVSPDLERWEWLGVVFAPRDSGWDRYCRRITAVVPHAGGYAAFYDGSASVAENYEERTGLALSRDLRSWRPVTGDAPRLQSAHASGSLRYVDARPVESRVVAFYECARADGAHELRVDELSLQEILA
jgi:hypothetical protein